MRRIRVTCYCSAFVEVLNVDDGKDGLRFEDVIGCCTECATNNHDFKKSSQWKEKPRDNVWLKSAHGVKQDEHKGDDQPELPKPRPKGRGK